MDEQGNEVFDEKKDMVQDPLESEKSDKSFDSYDKIEYEIKSSTVVNPVQIRPQMAQQKSGTPATAIVSMVFGILGILGLVLYIFSPLSIILGIVGLILGVISNKKAHSGIAVAGIATSAVSLGLGVLEFASCIGIMALVSNGIKSGADWLDDMDQFDFGPFQPYIDNIDQTMTI